MEDVTAKIQFKGDKQSTRLPANNWFNYRRTRPAESFQRMNYFGVVKTSFPADTLWFDSDYSGVNGASLNDQELVHRFPKGPPPGNLDGSATVDCTA